MCAFVGAAFQLFYVELKKRKEKKKDWKPL